MGRHKARTSPSPGNHDYHTPGAAGYYAYFGASAGDPAKGYYSYDIGGWHIIALNTECGEIGGCDTADPQGPWLIADLAASPSVCTLAYGHHPAFSSGNHGGSGAMVDYWQILYDANADVLLSGHDHNYERFALQDPNGLADPGRGVRQFVVGTGGHSIRTIGPLEPNSETNGGDFGVLRLTLNATSYDWDFVPVAGATYTDSGSEPCHSAGNAAPAVDAGPDQSVVLPGVATLDGAVTDDGLPDPPGLVTTTWSQESGPGTVTFGDPNVVDTTASFSVDGVYVLRLTADDSEFSPFDELTITVDPVGTNQPPTVDAGPDQTITLPADATLDGTVTDDGLRDPPGLVTTTWSQESGFGTVTFGDPNVVDTTASFSVDGVYVLRLTADDSEFAPFDELTVTVNPEGGGNVLDVQVSAGSDDAEERASGSVSLGSSDLELVFDGGGDQTVGMRFSGVGIPQGPRSQTHTSSSKSTRRTQCRPIFP